MKGFKDFIMRGNLIELDVAFIMAGAFAKVVEAFVNVVMSLIGKLGGTPDFNNWKPGDVPVGAFLTVLVAFLILAFVVYFFMVKPYEAAKARFEKPADVEDTEISVLAEIRDELRAQRRV